MKSQRAEKQGPQNQAPHPHREVARPQPDQARRRDQGRVDEEEQGSGGDDEQEGDR
jgi:hypothetical protein